MRTDPQVSRLIAAVFQPSGETRPGLRLLAGSGAPDVALGENTMYYLRWDGSGANTHLYHKEAGVWVGVV